MGSGRFAAAFQCAALLPFLAVIDPGYAGHGTHIKLFLFMINTENTAPAMIAKQTVYARKNQTFLLTFSSLFLRNLIF